MQNIVNANGCFFLYVALDILTDVLQMETYC